MSAFDTPEPIAVELDVVIANVRIIAADRADTTVDVRPTKPGSDADNRVAAETRVDYGAGRLSIIGPRHKPRLFGHNGSVEVTIELPTGSSLHGTTAVATFRGTGRLGECRIKTATGDVQLDRTGPLDLHTGAGAVVVDHVDGHAEVEAASGRVRLGTVDGSAILKNSNGDTWVGAIAGELRANVGNGDIRVDRAGTGVTASTARGGVRVNGLTRGAATLSAAVGDIEVGIDAGTAADLDVHTMFGRVENQLTGTDRPTPTEGTVAVHARTSYGDIVIRRSYADDRKPVHN